MQLMTTYAPPSFLKPVILIDTIFNYETKETAVAFVHALNTTHALKIFFSDEKGERSSDWIQIKQHVTMEEAIQYHLDLAKKLQHGSQEEWEGGWEDYLKLYEKYCPVNIKNRG